jgi:hypothetical protein
MHSKTNLATKALHNLRRAMDCENCKATNPNDVTKIKEKIREKGYRFKDLDEKLFEAYIDGLEERVKLNISNLHERNIVATSLQQVRDFLAAMKPEGK